MLEGKRKVINIKDIDGDIDDDTVMRFIEYAYTGDYTVPAPEILLSSNDVDISRQGNEEEENDEGLTNGPIQDYNPDDGVVPEPDIPIAEYDDVPNNVATLEPEYEAAKFSKNSKKGKGKKAATDIWYEKFPIGPNPETSLEPWGTWKKSTKQKLWSAFCAQATFASTETWKPHESKDPCENYTVVLLSHARLYVFSNRYACEGLMLRSLQKLHSTLSHFKLHDNRTCDITELLKYTYTHTAFYEEGYDKLRHLVLRYVVCHIEKIMLDEEFRNLLEEQGPLAKDLMVKLMERLN